MIGERTTQKLVLSTFLSSFFWMKPFQIAKVLPRRTVDYRTKKFLISGFLHRKIPQVQFI